MIRKKKGDWFVLSWKRFFFIILAWVIAVVLHNLLSAVLGFEEALFFILAVFVIPIYFVVCVIYSLVVSFKRN